jgi:hypothetical protein
MDKIIVKTLNSFLQKSVNIRLLTKLGIHASNVSSLFLLI